jgi:hypothetical protein
MPPSTLSAKAMPPVVAVLLASGKEHLREVGWVRLPTRALKAEATQRAFELRYAWSDALEVLTGERE